MAATTSEASQSLDSPKPTAGPVTEPLLTPSSPHHLRATSPRKRRRTPEASNPKTNSAELGKSPSPIKSPGQPTGAAEMTEQKRRKIMKDKEQSQGTSKNPQVEALHSLLATSIREHLTSSAQDAPNTGVGALDESLNTAIAPELAISEAQQQSNTSALTSPVSGASVATIDSMVPGNTANAPQMASPGSLDQDDDQNGVGDGGLQVEPNSTNRALSYPGPLLGAQLDTRRGMSLPGSSLHRDNSKSPSTNKKHKCPYCSTEFTRHHNLKSHLLTHSHEKPYLCQTCDSRFRRLHDLKRHTKLHTGERPHVCNKCNRSFARGDALARHNKGQGGCAGRRSSVGSYGGDNPVGGDDSMDGMVYANEASHEPDTMDEDEIGGSSLPSIRHHAPVQPPFRAETLPTYTRQPSTYPPVAARANMGGGLHPPSAPHGGSTGTATPKSQPSLQAFPAGASFPGGVLGPQPMTESPKPLSPRNPQPLSASDPRNRSPSLSGPASQQYGGRAQTRNTPPPALPHPTHRTRPQLPSLAGLAVPDARFTLHSTPTTSGPSPTLPHPQSGNFVTGPLHGSASNSLSSHGTNAHSSGDRGTMPFGGEDRLWAVIRSLETKVQRLEEEVRVLKGQPQPQAMQPPPTQPPIPSLGR